MTWFEIKKAADEAGITDDEEIAVIACDPIEGDKSLHRVTIGRSVKAASGRSPSGSRPATSTW